MTKFKYCADDKYCSTCGAELVFVCKKCFGVIGDTAPEHRICAACQAKTDDQRDRVKDDAGKALAGIGTVAGLAIAAFKSEKATKAVKTVVEILKK